MPTGKCSILWLSFIVARCLRSPHSEWGVAISKLRAGSLWDYIANSWGEKRRESRIIESNDENCGASITDTMVSGSQIWMPPSLHCWRYDPHSSTLNLKHMKWNDCSGTRVFRILTKYFQIKPFKVKFYFAVSQESNAFKSRHQTFLLDVNHTLLTLFPNCKLSTLFFYNLHLAQGRKCPHKRQKITA